MKWILGKNNITQEVFEKIEDDLKVKFPIEYKEIVLSSNGASPEPNIFDTEKMNGRVAEYLLSFDLKEKMNIIETYEILKDRLPSGIIPIINDPFGNYICLQILKEKQTSCIVFWEHETNNIEYISESFQSFLNMLYSE